MVAGRTAGRKPRGGILRPIKWISNKDIKFIIYTLHHKLFKPRDGILRRIKLIFKQYIIIYSLHHKLFVLFYLIHYKKSSRERTKLHKVGAFQYVTI